MIEVRERRIVIGGRPQLVMAGEIHYFRVAREEWDDRIQKLVNAGCNTAASYIPWLCHERADGSFDVTGRTAANLDLGAFIDLCHAHGLWFIARPGPFIMAELKNEGLPYRLYTEHPEIVPVTWDGKPVESRTVDYLAPAFLDECRRWYAAVMPLLAERLEPIGGPIIGVQLDNEIGMLSWITNSPDLTEGLVKDFSGWMQRRYAADVLAARYPFSWDDPGARLAAVRSPNEDVTSALHGDLGRYMRNRFARYVQALRGFAEDAGVRGVPFLVNVHGSGSAGGATFPIGISQLAESYTQAEGYLSGSDHYLGDLTQENVIDLHLMNAFMAAMHRPEQPLGSLEFEAGDGNYGRTGGTRYDPSALDFKLRMSLAQGNRLINFYLFAGGINAPLERPAGDGNDRVSFVGERHGTGAPVGAEGQISPLYRSLTRSVAAAMAVERILADADEEHDGIAMAFIPDYFLTEAVYPGSERMRAMVRNLETYRFAGPDKVMGRIALMLGLRFGAVDIQNRPLDPAKRPALMVATARYMDGGVQDRLVSFLRAGGRLLLAGEVPEFDLDGHPCTRLRDALGLTPVGEHRGTHRYFPALTASGWAAPLEEMRVGFAQTFSTARPEDTVLRVLGTDEGCGFDVAVGEGRAVALTTNLDADPVLWRTIFGRLGVTPALAHGCADLGIFMTTTATPDGQRLVHLLNLDGFEKRIRPTEHGVPLFGDGVLRLGARAGVMLPLGVRVGPCRIVWATTEVAGADADSVTFRVTQPTETVVLESARPVAPDPDYAAVERDGRWTVTSRAMSGWGDETLTIRFVSSG